MFSGKGEEALWRESKLVHEAPPGSTIARVDGRDAFLVVGPSHALYLVDFDGIVTAIEYTEPGYVAYLPDRSFGLVDPADVGADDAPTLPDKTL